MNNNSKIILRSIKNQDLFSVVKEIMDFCEWERLVKENAKVVIKPNLCNNEPDKVESANTSPALIEAVCKVLLSKTKNIIIGESDATRFPAEEAAEITGIFKIVERLGIKWLNFSKGECISVDHKIFNKTKTLMPKELLEADVVINMPVIKTHALTVFTGAVKNLWGCIPRYDRIILHKYLDELLRDLVKIIKPQINIMDGIVCVEGRGPTNGIPRRMDVVMASRDPVALDASAMRLISLDPYTSKPLVLCYKAGLGEIREEKILIDGPFDDLKVEFIPPVCDFAVKAMNYFTRYKFFVHHILLNDSIFKHTKKVVVGLRKIGILNDKPQRPKRRYLY